MKNCLLLLVSVFGAVELRAAIVEVAAFQDNGFSGAAGGNLPVNSLVRVGTFNIPDSQISQNSTNPSFLNTQFNEFGTARIGDNGGFAAHFDTSISNPNSDAQGFASKQIYLWVFNSADNSSVASSIATATEQGVFYLDATTPPGQNNNALDWRFHDHEDIPNNSVIELTDLTTADSGTLAPGARIVIGQFPHGTSALTGAANFGLVQIPEPSSLAVCLTSAVGFALRRRRLD